MPALKTKTIAIVDDSEEEADRRLSPTPEQEVRHTPSGEKRTRKRNKDAPTQHLQQQVSDEEESSFQLRQASSRNRQLSSSSGLFCSKEVQEAETGAGVHSGKNEPREDVSQQQQNQHYDDDDETDSVIDAFSPSVPSFQWELFSIPLLPESQALDEESCVFVKNTSIYDVSSRLTDVLRSRFIEAEYDPRNANGLKCGEVGNEFALRVYRRDDDDDDDYENTTIIVEVRRKVGTFWTYRDDKIFHEYRDAILKAVGGN